MTASITLNLRANEPLLQILRENIFETSSNFDNKMPNTYLCRIFRNKATLEDHKTNVDTDRLAAIDATCEKVIQLMAVSFIQPRYPVHNISTIIAKS